MSHEKRNLIDLIRTADRFLVEGTPEAKQELADLISILCRDYNQLRAVKRGPFLPVLDANLATPLN